jgi:hypothetical protein
LPFEKSAYSRCGIAHDRLELVMGERADDMADVLGGSSGLLVREVKQIGSGESSRMVEEYKLDTELLPSFASMRSRWQSK